MTGKLLLLALQTLMVVTACAGLWSYLGFVSPRPIEYATEQRDNSEHRVVKKNITQIGESFTRFLEETALLADGDSWPCFRGARRDNLVADGIALRKTWGADGPKVLWRRELGEGYAGAIIVGDRVYLLDYLEDEAADALRCFQLHNGEEIWRRSYKNPIRRNHGKSRTVPAYANNVVVTLGPAAHVMAVDATTGELLWVRDLVEEYGCEVPQWYAGQCPLIDGNKVILGIGGEKVLLAALDLKNGETLWEAPNDNGFKMSHSSVLATELAGREQYVYAAIGGIVGCNKSGRLLWQSRGWKPAVWAPTPVKIDADRLFLTAGYGAGSALLSLREQAGTLEAVVEQEWKPTRGPASEQQTPLVIDNTLFIIQPKDAGGLRGEMVAADLDALPAIKGTSGKQARFGLGPYLYADNAFWIADDDGVLHVYEYTDGRFKYLAHHKVLPGVDAWGPIAYAGGLMILRDSTSAVCLDLRKEAQP